MNNNLYFCCVIILFFNIFVVLNAFNLENSEPYSLYPYKITKIAELKNIHQLTVSLDQKHLFVGSNTSIYHLNLVWSLNLLGVSTLSAHPDYIINHSLINPTGVWLHNTSLYVRTNTTILSYDNILNKTKDQIPYLKPTIVKFLNPCHFFNYIKFGSSDLLYSTQSYIQNNTSVNYIVSFYKTVTTSISQFFYFSQISSYRL